MEEKKASASRRGVHVDPLAIAVTGVAVITIGWFFFPPYWLTVGTIMAMYSLPALGLLLLLGYAGQPSFGHAAFFGLGAYASALATTRLGWPSLAGAGLGIAVSAIAAFIVGMPLLRVRGHYLAIATLALAIIVQGLLENLTWLTNGVAGIGRIPSLGDTDVAFAITLGIATATYVVAAIIDHGRVGTILRALGDDEIAMASCGISPVIVKTSVFVVSAILASVAGSIYAHYLTYISPESFDVNASVLFVTMMIIGGTGRVWAGLIGAVVIGAIPAMLSDYSSYSALLYGIAIIAVLLFFPNGMLGIGQQIRASLRSFRRRGTAESADSISK